MKLIMANMDAKYLCTIRTERTLKELSRYVNMPDEGLSKHALYEIPKFGYHYASISAN